MRREDVSSERKFRAQALAKISSPEQLDRLVKVTPARRWIALAGLLAIVVLTLIWSTVTTVPTTLHGPGFLLPEGGLRQMQAPVAGTVDGLDLSAGKHVVEGQTIGHVRGTKGGEAAIQAPAAGTVTEVDSVSGAHVSPGQRLALVEPVGSPLVVFAYVPTNVAAKLTPGTPVHVTFGGGIGEAFGYAKGAVVSAGNFPVSAERLSFIFQGSSVIHQVQALGPANEVAVRLSQSAHTPSGLEWGRGQGPPEPLPAGLPAKATFVVGTHHPIDNIL
jgi:biotin carboxyl carrier protein